MKGRVWIYCSSKELTEEIQSAIAADTKRFLLNWKAHEVPLTADFEIRDKRFLIIKVDEESYAASGCSIDKQLKFIKETEQKYGIELLNRLLVPFKIKGHVEVVPASKIKELYNSSQISDSTTTYNTAISSTEELESAFEVPLKDSWVKTKL